MPKSPKDKAWDACSQFVRLKWCLKTTGKAFVGFCYTCERRFLMRDLDAGHFNSGRRNAVLFQDEGIRSQCTYCNMIEHGRHKLFREKLVKELGEDKVEQLEQDAKKVIQDKDMSFAQIEKDYKARTEKLMRKAGYKTFGEVLRAGQ